mmetsp:Transcript_93927/g.274960  ORF Transcript_93927/g.274960 Transcript_93927/m.274960 type:complete len:422 (-) Transcript_93927:109-1374(-)
MMIGDEAATNQAMVENLRRSGALRSPECVAAFKAVDRGHFWVEGSGPLAYTDMPLRHGRLHQSAPHIYARALEALLPLTPGLSFLNVGSGTGYFSSLVGELLGEASINDGIDIWPETLAHAAERCRQLGKRRIEFTLGNVYELDLNLGMRYDRIYLGACASTRAKYLYGLLEVGGILVGPFQVGHGQQLCRVVRESETQFKVEHLSSVHFAVLIEPAAPFEQKGFVDVDADSLPLVGLPGVPFTFALRQQPWSLERSWAYPEPFRRVASAALRGGRADLRAACLPPELWERHVLPWCPRWWFDPPPPPPLRPGSVLARAGSAVRKAVCFGAWKAGVGGGSPAARREDRESEEGAGLVLLLLPENQVAAPRRSHMRGEHRFWRRIWPLRWCSSGCFQQAFQKTIRHCAAFRSFVARCISNFT